MDGSDCVDRAELFIEAVPAGSEYNAGLLLPLPFGALMYLLVHSGVSVLAGMAIERIGCIFGPFASKFGE